MKRELHKDIFVNGERTYELPDILDIQKYNEQSLALFWEEYMRTLNPEEYPVDLSQECWDHKMNYIQTVREQVEKIYKNKTEKLLLLCFLQCYLCKNILK